MADDATPIAIRDPKAGRDPKTGHFLKGSWPGGPGAPPSYTEEMGQMIAGLLGSTPVGLKWLCKNVPGLPPYDRVLDWEDRYSEFGKLMASARRKHAATLVDECMEIADDTSRDHITIFVKGEPREVIDLAGVARARIRIDTRIKVAKLYDPQRFGDKLDINARVGGYSVTQDEAIDDLG